MQAKGAHPFCEFYRVSTEFVADVIIMTTRSPVMTIAVSSQSRDFEKIEPSSFCVVVIDACYGEARRGKVWPYGLARTIEGCDPRATLSQVLAHYGASLRL
jgi:hypothetical protein